MPELKSWLQSSQDPEKVSNTVKGIILSLSSVIVLVGAQFFHVQLSASDVLTLATQIGTVAGAVVFFYGLLMKGTIKMGSVKK